MDWRRGGAAALPAGAEEVEAEEEEEEVEEEEEEEEQEEEKKGEDEPRASPRLPLLLTTALGSACCGLRAAPPAMVPSEENQLVPKEAECAAEEPRVLCIIQDTTNSRTVNERVTLNLPASTPLRRLFADVAAKVGYVNGSFDLVWGNGDTATDTTPIDQNSDKTILDAGFEPGKKNFLHLTDKDGEQPHVMQEESGTAEDGAQERFIGPLPREGSIGCTHDYVSQSYSYSSVLSKSETGYVGLVNQAMTCYLNSLLQTLFMTPEFRNALYKWEFEESEEDPERSIPYQLQRLFVLLQTSKKRAIETTDVTRSFGWDSSEAWQQHDVQELCRVMFDALEQKWKQTEQADLINQLYQGKLKDYVRCLECGYEGWRIDTYLDIPLVIRPYGSSQAFASVVCTIMVLIVHPYTHRIHNAPVVELVPW